MIWCFVNFVSSKSFLSKKSSNQISSNFIKYTHRCSMETRTNHNCQVGKGILNISLFNIIQLNSIQFKLFMFWNIQICYIKIHTFALESLNYSSNANRINAINCCVILFYVLLCSVMLYFVLEHLSMKWKNTKSKWKTF